MAEIIITGLGTLALFFFGIVLNNNSKAIEKVEAENKEIKENYIHRFDELKEILHNIDKKVDAQANYCRFVQESKSITNK